MVALLPRKPENYLTYRQTWQIEMIALHWMGGAPVAEGYDVLERLASIAQYHIDKDWEPIAPGITAGHGIMYHWYIARDGGVWKTRDYEEICWHASGANDISVAICVECTEGQDPTEAQKAALLRLLERERLALKITRSAVRGHGELTEYGNSTACPGGPLTAFLGCYRAGMI